MGPAPINYSETLSTLLFAARCMSVKTTPIQHEEVDYAEMCANLQEKLSSVESRLNAKHQLQQARYQEQIKELQHQLDSRAEGLRVQHLKGRKYGKPKHGRISRSCSVTSRI